VTRLFRLSVTRWKRLKDQIKHETEPMDKGAEVKIAAGNPEVASAIHQFLKFQLEDHHTGDSTGVGP
jgi:hypothetical protein